MDILQGIYGKLDGDGNVDILYSIDGISVNTLDTTLCPVGSVQSCRYYHAEGIKLSRADAELLGVEVEA